MAVALDRKAAIIRMGQANYCGFFIPLRLEKIFHDNH